MSSSRRRGRSSGSPATGRPAAAVDEAPEAVAAEASQDAAPAETAETFAGWNGLAMRKAGSGRSPVRKRSG